MEDLKVPHMGLAMDEVTIIEWLCEVGDEVTQGQPVVELETDKADTEIESPVSGVLAAILAESGEAVEPGQVIARLLTS